MSTVIDPIALLNPLIPGSPAGFVTGNAPIVVTGTGPYAVSFQIVGEAQGDLVYRNATSWTRLAADNAGKVLQTGGAAANPSWTLVGVANTDQGGLGTVTVPGAYPYTTLATDYFVVVDSAGGARTVNLGDGTTYKAIVVADGGANAAANNITVALANALKRLNGTVGGTLPINVNGAQRGFWRDTSGNWFGGV